jgi:hypothetical protein
MPWLKKGPAKDIDNSLNGYKQEENTKQIVRSLARGQCRYAPAAVTACAVTDKKTKKVRAGPYKPCRNQTT